jgi:hypothetical protein
MSCNQYKKDLTEAAAAGHQPIGAAGEHLASCAGCREFFARELALFAAIASRLHEHANAKPSPSLLASVRSSMALAPAPKSRPGLFWVPVTASIFLAIAFSAWTIRHTNSGPSETQTLAANSAAPHPTQNTLTPHPQPLSARRTKHHQVSKAAVTKVDFRPLVPAGQPVQIDRLIGEIRSGVIDGEVLITRPKQDLQIPAIVIPPLNPDWADNESRGESGVSGISVSEPSLELDRSTR